MKERKIGEVFKAYGVTLNVVANGNCEGCYCSHKCLFGIFEKIRNIGGLCSGEEREDYEDVIFEEVK